MSERLILTSVKASVDLEASRGRGGSQSECARVIAFLNKLAGVSGTIGIAGQSRSMICSVAPSSDAGAGAAERCSGHIVLPGDDENKLLSTDIRFEARPGDGLEPGSLTLTFHPSRVFTGVDVYPTLLASSGKPFSYPASIKGVTNRLLEFPFHILAAINDANSSAKLFKEKVNANRIRIRRLEWTASLPCSDPNGLLEVLAISFGPLINHGGMVLQLARLLGLAVKSEADPRTNRMKSVSLEKRQGQHKHKLLFAIKFSAETANAVRLTIVAHPDGLAKIVTAARSWIKKLDDDKMCEGSRCLDDAGPTTAQQLGIAFWALARRRSAGKIVSRSLDGWLVPYLLRKILRLDVIGKFTQENLRRLSASDDEVARQWVAMSVEPDRNYAKAIVEATGLSDQTVYNRRQQWLKDNVDIEIPYPFYADLLSLGSLSASQSARRAALFAAEAGVDPEVTMRTLKNAFADFDRRRSIIGEIADATPSEVKVMTVDPTIDADRFWEGQGARARADDDRASRVRKPGSNRSKANGNRGAAHPAAKRRDPRRSKQTGIGGGRNRRARSQP